MMLGGWLQVFIALFGVAAVFLSQSESQKCQKYACVFGLLGQPLWLINAWQLELWGMFVLAVVYSAAWGFGFARLWRREVG